jgi:hypothetical protein
MSQKLNIPHVSEISYLIPRQKIITKKGFKNIELVKEGDDILTKEGLWKKCYPMSKLYKGNVYKISSYGQGSVEVTEDSKIWVMRDSTWQWVAAKDILLGDFIKQSWINYNFSDKSYICYDERITCSKPKSVALSLSTSMLELIGCFLGDGGIEIETETGISCGVHFSLDKKYSEIIQRIKQLISDVFDKEATEYDHSGNGVRLKFYSKGFSKWLKENCYDDHKEKISPFDIADLSDNLLRYLLKGLLETDGNHTEKTEDVTFENTSPSLAQTVYFITQRLGMNPSFYYRDPRQGGEIRGRKIEGKKEEFVISSGNIDAKQFIRWSKHPIPSAKKACNHGSCVGRINGVGVYDFKGMVYGISVEGDDPSFCVPGIAIG